MQIKIVNAQFSQVIDTGGNNQSELSSEIIRGGVRVPVPHRAEHAEQQHEEIHAAVVAEPEVAADVIDERANLISKLNAVIGDPSTSLSELQKLVQDSQQ